MGRWATMYLLCFVRIWQCYNPRKEKTDCPKFWLICFYLKNYLLKIFINRNQYTSFISMSLCKAVN